MSISQVLFDAIQTLETELQTPGEYGELLRQEIIELVQRMKRVQEKLDMETTEIDAGDPE